MTSNQIAYWKTEEEKRTNRAKEAETARSNLAKEAETARHNLSDEEIRRVANDLEAQGLKLRSAEDATKLMDILAKYPESDLQRIPADVRAEISEILGISDVSKDSGDSFINKALNYGKEFWKNLMGSRGIGSVGSLF